MNPLQEAKRFVRAGQFLDALTTLDAGVIERGRRTEADVLRAGLLERVGNYAAAQAQAEELLRSRPLTTAERSSCDQIVGRAHMVGGRYNAAVSHLQRAVGIAQTASDYERACWAQLWLLVVVSDHSGPDAAVSLLAELRANTARSADPLIVAALHLFVGQMEAKRSLLSSARRHVRLALDMLHSTPNVWLEALAEHIEVAIATVRVDFSEALERSPRAVELASRSGAKYLLATAQGNFGNLLFLTGDYERALTHQGHALKAFPPHSDNYIASLDNRVRIKLAQNELEQCHDLLAEIDHEFRSLESRASYVYRHSLLTRINVLSRCGRFDEALTHAQVAIDLGRSSADDLFFHLAVLTKAQLLVTTSNVPAAISTMDGIALTVALQPPDVYALYEGVIACALLAEKDRTGARAHFDRARRIYETLNYAPGLADLLCSSGALMTEPSASVTDDQQDSPSAGATAATTVQGLTILIIHAGRPELVARELVELLWSTRCVASAAAIFHRSDGSEETWARAGNALEAQPADNPRRLSIGAFRDGTMEVVAVLNSDVESVATFNSFSHLVESFHDLSRARAEWENRAALWPLDDVPVGSDRFLISGHMRELMNYARKIAKAHVNVLITGLIGRQQHSINHAFPRATGDQHAHPPGRIAVLCAERRAA
jgi:tetratricopeptide (TPR) repeat protein